MNVRTSFIEPLHKRAQERVVHGVFRYGGDGAGRVARDRLGSDATARPAQLLPRHVKWTQDRFGRPRYWGRDCRDADEVPDSFAGLFPQRAPTARPGSPPQARASPSSLHIRPVTLRHFDVLFFHWARESCRVQLGGAWEGCRVTEGQLSFRNEIAHERR